MWIEETLHQEEVEINDEKNEDIGFEYFVTTLITIEKVGSSNVTLVTVEILESTQVTSDATIVKIVKLESSNVTLVTDGNNIMGANQTKSW